MRTAILCSGPSLPASWAKRTGDYDIVIGVNAACDFIQCDWWAVGDWIALSWYKTIPRVGVCSQRDCLRVLREGNVTPTAPLPKTRIAWEDLPFFPTYSSVSGLSLAMLLDSRRVTYFGDDKKGVEDWKGLADSDRGEDRWAKERAVLNAAMVEASRRGIEVEWARG